MLRCLYITILYFLSSNVFASPYFYISHGNEGYKNNMSLNGQARFGGRIIVSTCTLFMSDIHQTIDMDDILKQYIQYSKGQAGQLSKIRLKNCDYSGSGENIHSKVGIRVSIDGMRSNSPNGIYLDCPQDRMDIKNTEKEIKYLPVVLEKKAIPEGNGILQYVLKATSSGKTLHTEKCSSIMKFNVDYD